MLFSKIIYILFLALYLDSTVSFQVSKNNFRFNSKPFITTLKARNDNFNDPWNYSHIIRINPTPIPIISFDDLFRNLRLINRVILTTNCDRVIIFYDKEKRGVFYMDPQNQDMLSKVRYLLSQIKTEIRLEYPMGMDNSKHKWYCEPRPDKDKDIISNISHDNFNNLDDLEENNENYEDYGDDFYID